MWWKVLWAKIGLGLLFTAIFFVLLWVNLFIAERLAGRAALAGPPEDIAARWRQMSGRRRFLIRTAVGADPGLHGGGAAVSGQWESWLFFVNATDFGLEDPQFGRDIGFYVFRLPFFNFPQLGVCGDPGHVHLHGDLALPSTGPSGSRPGKAAG